MGRKAKTESIGIKTNIEDIDLNALKDRFAQIHAKAIMMELSKMPDNMREPVYYGLIGRLDAKTDTVGCCDIKENVI